MIPTISNILELSLAILVYPKKVITRRAHPHNVVKRASKGTRSNKFLPTKEDIAMLHYIEYYAIPYVVCLTKADKIAKSKRKNEAVHKRKEIPSSFAYDILPVSSEECYGIQELLDYLERYLPKENLQEELGAGK